jgi:hypothetical protein
MVLIFKLFLLIIGNQYHTLNPRPRPGHAGPEKNRFYFYHKDHQGKEE